MKKVLISLLILVVAIFIFYRYRSIQKTYINQTYGFEFSYPAEFSLQEDVQNTYSIIMVGGNIFQAVAQPSLVKEKDICYQKKEGEWCYDGNPDDRWVTLKNNNNIGVTFYCWFPESKSNLKLCNNILSSFKFTK